MSGGYCRYIGELSAKHYILIPLHLSQQDWREKCEVLEFTNCKWSQKLKPFWVTKIFSQFSSPWNPPEPSWNTLTRNNMTKRLYLVLPSLFTILLQTIFDVCDTIAAVCDPERSNVQRENIWPTQSSRWPTTWVLQIQIYLSKRKSGFSNAK